MCIFTVYLATTMRHLLRKITIGQIILGGCLITLLYAILSQGTYHADEHFQILEYAHMKLFGTPTPDNLAWEYPAMMRPGLQPLIAYCTGSLLLALGLYSPFVHVFLLQLLSGAFSVTVLLFFMGAVRKDLGTLSWRKWYLILGFFLWFMAYLHVHFSAEMISGNALLLLAALFLRYRESNGNREFTWGMAMGAAAGLAFIVKFQTGFALAGFGLWLLFFLRRWKLYTGIALGFIVLIGIGALSDYWLYGKWVCTPINYLTENILHGAMSNFEHEPWWYYLTAPILEGGIFFGLLALIATLYFFIRRPRHIVTWMLIPFLLIHFFLVHKELRFFFPVLFFVPWFIVVLIRNMPRKIIGSRPWHYTVALLAVLNLCAMIYPLTIDTPALYFAKLMRRYCEDKERVTVLIPWGEQTYYSIYQGIGTPRMAIATFYMPDNMKWECPQGEDSVELRARALSAAGEQVVILSSDPQLHETSPLPLHKLTWSPYPNWVIRYFNFNDWTRFTIRSKNIYEIKTGESHL